MFQKEKKILRIMRKLKVTKWFDFTYPKKMLFFFKLVLFCICCGLNNLWTTMIELEWEINFIHRRCSFGSFALTNVFYFDWVVCLLWVLLHFQCILDILLFFQCRWYLVWFWSFAQNYCWTAAVGGVYW